MDIRLDTYRKLDLAGLPSRRVDVWLPPEYAEQPEKRFPVLYMHDGQNVFKGRPSIGPGWQATENVTALSQQGAISAPIVVGMTSTLNRIGDYMPQKAYDKPGAAAMVEKHFNHLPHLPINVVSDLYLEWIVKLVKPLIDRTYRTLAGPEHTVMMGSSMGGLISIYGLCEYPDVFGAAGCLSTHWPVLGDAMLDYLREALPLAGRLRLYFDHGTEDLDASYAPWQEMADQIILDKGYQLDQDFVSLVFPGAGHHERFWAERLQIPLTFLFGRPA